MPFTILANLLPVDLRNGEGWVARRDEGTYKGSIGTEVSYYDLVVGRPLDGGVVVACERWE